MTPDREALRRAAEASLTHFGTAKGGEAYRQFIDLADCTTILALLAERDALQARVEKAEAEAASRVHLESFEAMKARAEAAEAKLAQAREVLKGDHEVRPLHEDRLERLLDHEEHFRQVAGPHDSATFTWSDQRALLDEAVLAFRARTFLATLQPEERQ